MRVYEEVVRSVEEELCNITRGSHATHCLMLGPSCTLYFHHRSLSCTPRSAGTIRMSAMYDGRKSISQELPSKGNNSRQGFSCAVLLVQATRQDLGIAH